MESSDSWVCLIFVGTGLLMVLMELIVGVDTGLDLVFIGTAFILGGLVTWPFDSWVLTIIVTMAVCLAYLVVGRRYIHKWTAVREAKTNVDTMVGMKGIVTQKITNNMDGRVRVGNEDWKARAIEEIEEGEEIVVTEVSGVTLVVKKTEGGE